MHSDVLSKSLGRALGGARIKKKNEMNHSKFLFTFVDLSIKSDNSRIPRSLHIRGTYEKLYFILLAIFGQILLKNS